MCHHLLEGVHNRRADLIGPDCWLLKEYLERVGDAILLLRWQIHHGVNHFTQTIRKNTCLTSRGELARRGK